MRVDYYYYLFDFELRRKFKVNFVLFLFYMWNYFSKFMCLLKVTFKITVNFQSLRRCQLLYLYMYICTCECVCVYIIISFQLKRLNIQWNIPKRKRERERERKSNTNMIYTKNNLILCVNCKVSLDLNRLNEFEVKFGRIFFLIEYRNYENMN